MVSWRPNGASKATFSDPYCPTLMQMYQGASKATQGSEPTVGSSFSARIARRESPAAVMVRSNFGSAPQLASAKKHERLTHRRVGHFPALFQPESLARERFD